MSVRRRRCLQLNIVSILQTSLICRCRYDTIDRREHRYRLACTSWWMWMVEWWVVLKQFGVPAIILATLLFPLFLIFARFPDRIPILPHSTFQHCFSSMGKLTLRQRRRNEAFIWIHSLIGWTMSSLACGDFGCATVRRWPSTVRSISSKTTITTYYNSWLWHRLHLLTHAPSAH